MAPPLVLDIDGTLTRPDARRAPPAIDPRLMDPLREWEGPLVLATGKSFPYPVALCQFLGREALAVAETGGIALVRDRLRRFVDPAGVEAVARALRDRGLLATEGFDDSNYWRETELAVPRELPEATLQDLATEHGLTVVDSGYAYHVKDGEVSKGRAAAWVVKQLDLSLAACVAIGDSANDVSVFERAGRSFALANADDAAQAAADVVTDAGHADGTLAVLDELRAAE